MKTKLLLLTCLFIFTGNNIVLAQTFNKAPAPKVKSIIEWGQSMPVKEPHVFKGSVYDFREDGKLSRWTGYNFEIDVLYEYDKLGRIKEKTVWEEGIMTEYKYGYKKWYYAEVSERNGRTEKTFYYVNKKLQVIEKKVFDKLPEDKDYILDRRTIYKYNDRDSLQGETHYNYFTRFGSNTIEKRWVLYSYDKKTGKRILEKHLNDDNEVTYFVEYEYDDKGRITFRRGRGGDGEYDDTTEYLYKNGKLWQRIEISRTEQRIITVYKNGIPVREKTYERKDYDGFYTDRPEDWEMIQMINFQYLYYD